MIHARLISLLCLVIAYGGCHTAEATHNQNSVGPNRAAQTAPADTEIVLERQECDLTCPVYKVTISGDGSFVYEGRRFVKRTGIVRGSIGREKLAELVSEVERIGYFSLKDKYSPGGECPQAVTDYPTAITSVRLGGKSKRIEHYYGCTGSDAIQALADLESKIDQAVNSRQWVE
ncbi:MAG: DUF6438 domain-containing protein [Acidobacteriota bacterium]|nr:DUF6438 domain-containing protein [Acidobacteriota bacterium]